jgi:CubicO group peptidase (beta-lactamase class C family)
MRRLLLFAAMSSLVGSSAHAQALPKSRAQQVDAIVRAEMDRTKARGVALAFIDGGEPVLVRAWGQRNAAGDPLTDHTVMYGASLTKTVFAYTVMKLAEEGRLDLDRSIAEYLPRPLPDYGSPDAYGDWAGLAGDDRWRAITPRMLLTHSAGFSNFHWDEPDQRLRIHFAPGTRYAYSGEGIILLQFVLEEGLGLKLGEEMEHRVFTPLGMSNTSMTWRPDFAGNLADGWRRDGSIEPHDERSRVRAAGSMDTTVQDFARFAAAFIRGEGLSPASRSEITRAQLPITSRSQFPSLSPEAPIQKRWPTLAAGLGLVTFEGPQGRGFFKGGHNDSTGNMWVCLEKGQRCVVLLANDVRAEAAFPSLVEALLGPTGLPWRWEYSWLPEAQGAN